MDICGDILQRVEIENIEQNDIIYDLVLQEFLSSIDVTFDFEKCNELSDKIRHFKEHYIYTSPHAKLFFEILAKYNYNMRQEIKDAMFSLGHLEDPNNNKELIKKILSSPVIQDISFNGINQFTISSEQYGEFIFELASYYYRKNKRMTDYMKNNTLPHRCHNHTYFISEVFSDFYAITSLCRFYFKGNHFHSYTLDPDRNSIIDLCYNGIIDKGLYYQIFQPQEISVILNSKVAEELAITKSRTIQFFNRCSLLKIALYKQYLNSIGYQGSLEKAPSIKSR